MKLIVLLFVYFVKVLIIIKRIILTLKYHIHNHGYFSKQIQYFKMINSKITMINNCLTDMNGKIIHCISKNTIHHLIGNSSIFMLQFNQRLRVCNDSGWKINPSSISDSKRKICFIRPGFAWNIFKIISIK